MKPRLRYAHMALLLLLAALGTSAQDFDVDWHTIDGGGGTSSGGPYELSGTIGQPDSSVEPLVGGDYELTGGFWPGWVLPSDNELPALFIQHTPSGIIVSWPPGATGASLEETSDLTSGSWLPSSTANGIPVAPTDRTMYYRLVR